MKRNQMTICLFLAKFSFLIETPIRSWKVNLVFYTLVKLLDNFTPKCCEMGKLACRS